MSMATEMIFVLWEWPSRSERFVERELEALAELGCRPSLVVLGPATAPAPAALIVTASAPFCERNVTPRATSSASTYTPSQTTISEPSEASSRASWMAV